MFHKNIFYNNFGWNLGVTKAYVQGGTEIQIVYPTDLYLPTISLQFKQTCTKIYNVDKNYKDLTYILLTVRRWRSASHDTEMQAWDAIPHIYHILGMVTKYCQYEVLNFADKLHIQYIPFKLLSVSDNAGYIQKNIMNDEESDYKA